MGNDNNHSTERNPSVVGNHSSMFVYMYVYIPYTDEGVLGRVLGSLWSIHLAALALYEHGIQCSLSLFNA